MTDLSNQLSRLDAGQLATITWLSGIDSKGDISQASYEGYVASTINAANPKSPPTSAQIPTWQSILQTGATVTYDFLANSAAYAFTPIEQDMATQVLQMWSGMAGINFQYRNPGSGAEVSFVHSGDTFADKDRGTIAPGTLWALRTIANTSTPNLFRDTTGDVHIDGTATGKTLYGSISDYKYHDGYGVDTLVHEVGHLLGLGHAGPYNQVGTKPVDWGPLQRSATDTTVWSVMSYISPATTDAAQASQYGDAAKNADFGNEQPFSPMALDIFAAQRLYGGPTSGMFSGGKTFGFHSTVMYTKLDGTQARLSMYDFDQPSASADPSDPVLNDYKPVVTLFDTGSNNTLDLSGYTADSTVNLNDGQFSSVDNLINNIFIEYGTQIDHLVEGSGNDVITANDRSDVIDGGGGTNLVKFSAPRSAYVLSYAGTATVLTNSSSGAAYKLTNIQQVQFGSAPAIALSDLPRVQWVGPSGGHFGIGANWSDGQVPNGNSQLQIAGGANILVTHQERNEVDSLTLGVGASIDVTSGDFTIDNAAAGSTNSGTISVESGTNLYLAGGLTNIGTLGLYGGTLQTHSAFVSLSGGGTVTLQNGQIGGRDASGSPLAYDTFFNVDNVISGSGSIGRSGFLYPVQFHNGENANVIATGGTLVIAGATINDGILGASDNGTLDLSGPIDQTSGGRIVALGTNTRILLDGGTITGGSLAALTGTVEVTSNETLAGVAVSGAITVDAGKTLTLTGTIDATGATIDASAGTLDVSQAHITGGAFKFSPNQSLDGVTVSGADLSGYQIGHNQTVTIRGAVTNSTLLQIAGYSGYGPARLAVSGTATLSGGGTVTLSDLYGAMGSVSIIDGANGADQLENVDNTIAGYGELGRGTLAFANDVNGTVKVTSGTLRIWTTSASNAGLLESTGGLLLIETALNDGGGTILAADGGRVQLGGEGRATSITAGILRSTGSGVINVDTAGVTFDGSNYAVNQQANLHVQAAATLTAKGIIANTGTIYLDGYSGYSLTSLAISGSVTLQGGGMVQMADLYGANGAVTAIAGSSAADTLTNADNRISGYGFIGNGAMTLVNSGSVIGTVGTLTLDTGAAAITNHGALEGYGGTLVINSAVNSDGLIAAITAGVVTLRQQVTNSGTVAVNNGGLLKLDGGSLVGTGQVAVASKGAVEVTSAGLIDGRTQTVTLGGALAIDAAATLTLKGTIGNGGSIAINGYSGYGQTTLAISGAVTLQGGGSVTLGDLYGANGIVAAIAGASAADTLTNADNRISGYGSIGQGKMTLANAGSIVATGGALTIDTGAAGITNHGALEGYGGTLVINSDVNSDGLIASLTDGSVVVRKLVTNAGVVAVNNSGLLKLDGGSLAGTGQVSVETGGTLEVSSTGLIDGRAQTVTLAGSVGIDAAATLTVKGTIANSGSIAINGYSGYGQTTLAVSGAVTLQGGGRVSLGDLYGANGNVAAIAGASADDVLTNKDNVITGYGSIGQGTMTLVNGGAIVATAATLTVDTGAAKISNSGLLAGTGGTLVLASAVDGAGSILAGDKGQVVVRRAVTGNGTVQAGAGGTVVLDGAALASSVNASSLQGGTIEVASTATIDGTVHGFAVGGTVAIDRGASLTIAGSVGGSGTIAVNGYSGYEQSRLLIAGTATLSGGGKVTLSDQYGAFGQVAAIGAAASGAVLANVNDTISGYGELGQGGLAFVNLSGGVVDASQSQLRLEAATTNTGLLKATGGMLRLESTVTNGGGTILAAGGTVLLGGDGQAATIRGGTLRATGTGSFTVDQVDSTLDGSGSAVALQGRLSVSAGRTLTLMGSVGNFGDIALNGYSGYSATTLAVSGAVTLTGGGTIGLSDGYGVFSDVSAIAGASAADTLDNVDNVISGYGHIASLTMTNEAAGVVAATAATLTIDTAAAGATLTNKGLLEGLGGTLSIGSNTVNTGTILGGSGGTVRLQRVVSNAGVVRVDAGGRLLLDGGAVAGTGTFTSAQGGTVEVASAGVINGTGQTVTLGGATTVDAGALLVVGGTIRNTGAIAVNGRSGYGQTTLLVSGPATLSGGGSVTLSDTYGVFGDVATLAGNAASAALENVDNVISGTGELGGGALSFVNDAAGVVNATGGTLRLDFGSGTATNNGLLEATGGTLALASAIGNTGRVLAAGGTVSVASGAATNLSGGRLMGGTWTARGSTIAFADGLTADAATLVLDGAGSAITAGGANIEGSLGGVAAGGSLQVLGGRGWAGTTALSNAGEIRLGGGTFAAPSIANTGLIDGTGTIAAAIGGSGTIEAAGGTLTPTGQVSGALVVDAGSTLVVKGGAAVGTTLHFAGPGGTVQIVPGAGAQPFNGRVLGSTVGDTIDLVGVAATGVSSGSTLTLSYGGATIGTVTFDAGYAGKVASDGHGGTLISAASSSPDPLFDPVYYLANNPDVAAAGIDPYQHYMTMGWKEGRNPSALFNTNYYLNQNPDVRAAGINPLAHYESSGWKEGRDPSILFSTSRYLAANPDVAAVGFDPLVHYVTSGQAEGRAAYAATPHDTGPHDPLVDDAYVYAHNPGVAAAGLDASAWFDTVGWTQGADPDAYFSTSYYLNQNPDVRAAGINPLAHYEGSGWQEGRDPSVLFSSSQYLAANPDVHAAGFDPLVHYLLSGRAEGRAAPAATPHATGPQDPLVDAAYVYAHNPAVAAAGLDATAWFNSVGWQQGANPDGYFDTSYYLAQNPDVKAAGINPLAHFESSGWMEGRQPSLAFDDAKYLSAYPDVRAVGFDPLVHFVQAGQAEGRMAFLTGGAAAADPLVDAAYFDNQLGATIIPGGTAGAQQAAYAYDHGGWQAGLNPDAFFDTSYYLSHNPDVAAAHIDPLTHYEQSGWKEGRDPSAAFSTNKYLAAYADVKGAGLDPLLHYVGYGQAEGRQAFSV